MSNGKAGTMSARTALPAAEQLHFLSIYAVDCDTIYFLGLVHVRSHPDFLKDLVDPGAGE
jgi:hypothetical protein